MTPVEKRINTERKVIRHLLSVAWRHGYALTRVWNGECNEYPKTEEQALDEVFSVDECTMRFKHPDQPKSHCAVIVLGNSGWDCIADCSEGEGWDQVMSVMTAYCDRLEAK